MKYKWTIFLILMSCIYSNIYADSKNNVIINMNTKRGNIKIELYKQKEPQLVNFFLNYVQMGFYNNLIFHRVVDGFLLQSGAYDVNFKNKEIQLKSKQSFNHSSFKNNIGTISLILRKDNSAISSPQFFINLADNSYLNSLGGNYEYEVIGKVISGMDVVEKIARIKVGQREGMYNVPFYASEALINKMQ